MLTPEELAKARELSAPSIPDDDDTAKQLTRQLVRKILAHNDEVEANSSLYWQGRMSAIEAMNAKDAALHAAIDRAEKAEESEREAMATHKCRECGAKWRLYNDGKKDWWILASKNCGKCCDNAPMVAQIEPIGVHAKVAELQAIVDRMQGPWKTKDGISVSECATVWHFCNEADCPHGHGHPRAMVVIRGEATAHWKKPVPVSDCYSTHEAALSSAASPGAKEKQ